MHAVTRRYQQFFNVVWILATLALTGCQTTAPQKTVSTAKFALTCNLLAASDGFTHG